MNRISVMWTLVILAYTSVTCAQQQNSRRPEPHDNGHGWDIRLAVPGEPGGDYPTLKSIPRTSFSCSGKSPGYYADVETGCQVFRVCTLGSTYGFQSFLCPNGTLFNQEVFVCDWWMNVNCERSRQLINTNRDKFGNLKLGPELMKDIKKMLTHPMRNPYDKTVTKSNIIVMQNYKPPSGQLFPNGALISGPERPPSNIYVPPKQRQGNFQQNQFLSGDLSFAASTPSSQYIPTLNNAIGPFSSKDIEILQQQRQHIQSAQNSPSHTGHQTRARTTEIFNNRISQPPDIQNQHHYQRNIQQQYSLQNVPKGQSQGIFNNNFNEFSEVKKESEPNSKSHMQQYTHISRPNEQRLQNNNIPQQHRDMNGREVKQNLLSTSNIAQPTGKTLKFSRIVQKSSSGSPKSRVTFKTWIVRPSKTARLVAEPTAYTYNNPENSPSENRLVDITTNDSNEKEKVNPETEAVPYVYNKPAPSNQQVIPTAAELEQNYLPPTAATLSNLLYSTSKVPVQQSSLNLVPTTYKPASQFQFQVENSLELSRQYLSPAKQSPQNGNNYQSGRLVATPTTPELEFTTVVSNNKINPSFSLTKQSHINTNHNNLSFADILTREKLDVTVNDIVKDTDKILKTASPEDLSRYSQNHESDEYLNSNYLSPEFETENFEYLSTQIPAAISKSEKYVATPSTKLEPPIISPNNYYNSNKLVNLPYFKESAVPTNTIERTVTLKITIPEAIAKYLFKNESNTDPENIEILNTGSSNYLVLTNKPMKENNDASLIPIGKLSWDKYKNISNSDAFVYSFLADSINAANVYSNIAKQNLVLTSTQPKIQNINHENISEITDKIAHLTSAQFSKQNHNNDKSVILSRNKNQQNYIFLDSKEHSHQPSAQNYLQHSQFSRQSQPEQLYQSHLERPSDNNLLENLERNSNKIYSGQLYKLSVPEVTSKIYNSPNLDQTSHPRQANGFITGYSQNDLNEHINGNKIKKQSNTDVEIIPTEAAPYPPTRQQLPRVEESTFNTYGLTKNIFGDNFFDTKTGITAQVQDKISGSLPHPLEENKLVTYHKNKSYYLYTKLEHGSNENNQEGNTITEPNESDNLQKQKIRSNDEKSNRVTYELFPSINYEIEDDKEKQQILNSLKINDISDSKQYENGRIESFNQSQDDLVTGVDFTILHPSSRKQNEQQNNINTILYRGPSSYLAPQSSVGSLGGNQPIKSNANSRIEQLEENKNNGYPKIIPVRQFSF